MGGLESVAEVGVATTDSRRCRKDGTPRISLEFAGDLGRIGLECVAFNRLSVSEFLSTALSSSIFPSMRRRIFTIMPKEASFLENS